ncbi:MAG: NADH-quinone oxidoreductase subunit L [Planctomycetota bacterium]|nr:NADH-quinone oxidoreductase subunit L [Planctomycetota bacterium]
MSPPIPWPEVLPFLALFIPLSFGVAALSVSRAAPFRWAGRVAGWNGLLAVVIAVALLVGPREGLPAQDAAAFVVALEQAIRLDAVTSVMLLLVSAIAIVIVRYSRTYIHGDECQERYARALLAVLGTVTLLVVANNLLVIALAWIGTSLALHQLLTTYGDRPQALVAAHKKFLLSRLADACVLGAVALLWSSCGSANIDVLLSWARANPELTLSAQVAAVLLVCGVALKSAQLPFHGWLIQVMEAPTPVSALLHAGVVNIGGFLMIRLAPFMAQANVAQYLLIVVGTTTAVLAALIMTTRVSVKVSLAWSTCAQMGMMLLQCGLGLWHLALLHLVAHSLYKAHAFLSSGTVVEGWRAQAIRSSRGPMSPARVLAGAVIVLASVATVVGLAMVLTRTSDRFDPTLLAVGLLLAMSLSPMAIGAGLGGRLALLGASAFSIGVSALYLAWHALFGHLVVLPAGVHAPLIGLGIAAVGFSMLFVAQLVLHVWPASPLARTIQPWLFAGLYLDEVFTRMTFRLWPPGRSSQKASTQDLRLSEPLEA